MTMAGERWPDKDEYDIAIAKWAETIIDPELRNGTLDFDHLGIRKYGGANLYVCVYRINDWMVRCFCSNGNRQPPADIRERYLAIARFSQQQSGQVSAIAPVTYFEQGIYVGTHILPLVKMPFFTKSPSLGEFIMDNYTETDVMQQLCEAWLRMVSELESAQIAHGDLDLSNVLVEQRGPALVLRLIDYDNMWIPELAGHAQTEYGHQHFQHPHFLPPNPRPYTADMDTFSALTIFISLKALVTRPKLYDDWGADESERLLFTESDYRNASLATNRITALRDLSSPDLHPYIDELLSALRAGRMPRSLTTIAPVTIAPVPLAEYRPLVVLPMEISPEQSSGKIRPALPPIGDWGKKHTNQQEALTLPGTPLPPQLFSGSPQSVQPMSKPTWPPLTGLTQPEKPAPVAPAPIPASLSALPDQRIATQPSITNRQWALIALVVGLALATVVILALLKFVPAFHRSDIKHPINSTLLVLELFEQQPLLAHPVTSTPPPALSLSPTQIGYDSQDCSFNGATYTCQVTLSVSYVPLAGKVQWQANSASSTVNVNAKTSTFTHFNLTVSVAISGLECIDTNIRFTGIETDPSNPSIQVTPVNLPWHCVSQTNPIPQQQPSPTQPTPTPTTQPTNTPTPAPTHTPTPAPTPTKSVVQSHSGSGPDNPNNPGGEAYVGDLLTIAALVAACLAFLLYLLPRTGEQASFADKLRSFFLPGLFRRH